MNGPTSELEPVDRLRDEAGRLLVCRAVERDDWISQSLLDIAAGSRKKWNPSEWRGLICDLQACRLRISDWLDLNT